MKFQAPKGTRDILPGESEAWAAVERSARETMARYGYREVRTPTFESTDLFVRGVGASTDIVRKELYTFEDKGGRSITLRPEMTAPLVRAYLEHSLGHGQPMARFAYIGPMYRYERPQAGRFRQFQQIGAELFGPGGPAADAEMIDLFVAILQGAGIGTVSVLLNSLGDGACRPAYRDAIRSYFESHADTLCGDCRERLRTNPLRILDCKVPGCQPVIAGAPSVLDSLCDSCREHFEGVKAALAALEIPFEVVPRLVRGLDYYTRTVFEVHAGGLGAQNAVGGGGRYDDLVKEFGGPPTPAIGFSIGVDRLLMAAAAAGSGVDGDALARPDVCVIAREPAAIDEALRLARDLRGGPADPPARRLAVVVDLTTRSLNAQMKWASKTGARHVVFVPSGQAGYSVRDMEAGTDETGPTDAAALRAFLLGRSAAGAAR